MTTEVETVKFWGIYSQLERTINEFPEIGKITLPRIVVVGSQSSGKSSVLEAVLGIDILPKDKGLCTRCPIRIEVTSERRVEEDANPTGASNTDMDFIMFEGSEHHFSLEEARNELKRRMDSFDPSLGIVKDELKLKIYDKTMSNLILIDLPGLVANEQNLPKGTMRNIEKIVRDYLPTDRSGDSNNTGDGNGPRQNAESNSNGFFGTIILAITAANSDRATSSAIHEAVESDPSGRNTIHVLTKLDILDRGVRAEQLLESYKFPGHPIGVVGVVNRAQADLDGQKNLQEARRNEEKFFKENCPRISNKHGILTLRKLLIRVLKERLESELPRIKLFLQKREEECSKELNKFPALDLKSMESFSDKQMFIIYQRINSQLLGKSRFNGLGESSQIFGAKIYEYLQNQFQTKLKTIHAVENLNDADILNAIKESRGIRGPVFIPNEAFVNICSELISQLKGLCLDCEDHVFTILKNGVMDQLASMTLSNFPILKQKFEEIVLIVLKKRHENARNQIEFLIKMEDSNIVVNDEAMKKLGAEVLAHSTPREEDTESSTPTINRSRAGHREASHHDPIEVEANQIEIQGLRKLVAQYFKTVRKRIGEMVQKALVTVLAMGIDEDIHHALRDAFTALSEDERREVFSEPVGVAKQREDLTRMSNALKQMIDDIGKLERQLKLQ